MPDNFQTCPVCESLILSDTPSCPECGHHFSEGGDEPTASIHERGTIVYEPCPNCGDDVPAGLLRCWSCNTFMREDVEEKYKQLVGHPQTITFSDVPPDQRTEMIPPRRMRGGYARILDADDDEFTLQWEDSGGTEFELHDGSQFARKAAPAPEPTQEVSEPSSSEADVATESPDKPDSLESDPADSESNADDLLSIALIQEKETVFRKRERLAAMNRKRILIPCPSCGVWLRVREEQVGRTVRCRSCRKAVSVPQIRRKEKTPQEEKVPEITLHWIEDVQVHLVVPTDITLKPGSLQDTWQSADAAFDADGLHLIVFDGAAKKKSRGSRGASNDLSTKRAENREQIQKSGGFIQLPHGELHTIPSSSFSSVQLVQPVRQPSESMFAGVPIFGEGRIVIYLPLSLEDDRLAFCSMSLSRWREFERHLKMIGVTTACIANGVPESEVHSSPLCHYSQAKVETIRGLVYYENDSAFELELTGYRCTACGIAISEAGRARNKLGGAAGKSIAKAKCPKCSAKFGREPLFRISKAPETLESDNDHPDSPEAAAADEPEKSV